MKKQNLISLVVIAGLALLALMRGDFTEKDSSPSERPDILNKSIYYTKHAKCRIDCREINKAEIKEVLRNGRINHKKSEKNAQPCPTFAYEHRVEGDKQLIRVVIADCKDEVKIITVIDLENEYRCNCY